MSTPTLADGCYYAQNQKKVQSFTANGVISDDVDVAVASTGTPTLTLPAHAKPGQVVKIVALNGAVTVAANTNQQLGGSGATTVAANFSRDYVAITDSATTNLIWVAQALA